MSYLQDLLYKIQMPQDATEIVLSAAEKWTPAQLAQASDAFFAGSDLHDELDALACHACIPYETATLCVLLLLSERTKADYRAAGWPEAVFYDTMDDYTVWAKTGMRACGYWGIPRDKAWWTCKHLRMELVRLGRLQFEPSTFQMDAYHGCTMDLQLSLIHIYPSVHGVLIFMPLPRQIDAAAVCAALDPAKDVDGITEGSRAAVYAGAGDGFPPCTAEACLHILEHYGVDPAGKKAAVIGRSLVIGKPVAMLLLRKNATVTICHSRTPDLEHVVHDADLVVAATGKIGVVGKNAFRSGQIVIDVGMNVGPGGKMCGDVGTDDAAEIVQAITPVPGGVGSVTTSVPVSYTHLTQCR